MKLTKAIDEVRFEINDDDDTNGYRFSRLDFEDWYRDAIRDIYRKRPDVRMNEDFELNNFQDPYRYDQSAYVLSDFYDIIGWDKITYPTLYFLADADNSLVAYSDASHGLAYQLFSLSWSSFGDYARILGTGGTFGGLIRAIDDISSGESFTVTASELDIAVDFFIERAIVYYLAYSAFSRDNEDTFNGQRSQDYWAKFLNELGVLS